MDVSLAATNNEAIEESTFRKLARILSPLYLTWHFAAVVFLLIFTFAILCLIVLRFAIPSTTTYIARAQFVFPQAESGIYPSGLPFTINDVIDGLVLNSVYEQLKLNEFNIPREVYFNGFSIRPFALTEREIAERFSAQFSDRRLTFSERERLEVQLKQKLEQASRSGAELAFSLRGRFGIPDELGRQIVTNVLLTWSRVSIERRGVLRLPGSSGTGLVIEPDSINKLAVSVAIVTLVEETNRLLLKVSDLRLTRGIDAMVDPPTGRTIDDISRETRNFLVYRVNPLRGMIGHYNFGEGAEEIISLAEQRIRDLQTSISEATRTLSAISDTMTQFVNAYVGLKGRTGRTVGLGTDQPALSGGNTVIPQIGPDFLDRLTELVGRPVGPEQTYIIDLSNRHLALSERAIRLKSELDRWIELAGDLRSKSGPQQELTPDVKTKLGNEVRTAVEDLNSRWAAINRLEAEFAANRLINSSQLYSQYAVERDIERFSPILEWRNFLVGLAASVLLTMIFWGGIAWRHSRLPREHSAAA